MEATPHCQQEPRSPQPGFSGNMDAENIQFSGSAVCDFLWPHGLQHTRLPCPSPTPRNCSLSQWCHPTISPSVIPFSSCLQSFPASGSFLRSQFFASGGQCWSFSFSISLKILDQLKFILLVSYLIPFLNHSNLFGLLQHFQSLYSHFIISHRYWLISLTN